MFTYVDYEAAILFGAMCDIFNHFRAYFQLVQFGISEQSIFSKISLSPTKLLLGHLCIFFASFYVSSFRKFIFSHQVKNLGCFVGYVYLFFGGVFMS